MISGASRGESGARGGVPQMAKKKETPKARTKPAKDEVREERIDMEIVVDAYNADERAMGWYSHLTDTLDVPFGARCIEERSISPLAVGDEVEVIGMPAGGGCDRG